MRKIVEIKFGSHLYGTATENSDIDIKSIYIPDPKDIILQRVRGSISNKRHKEPGEKNIAGEIDEECFSLQRYLQLLSEGQTVALDMMFSPKQSIICEGFISGEWAYITENKHKFLSKKSAAFVGYCRQQANKYGIKGSRVAAVRLALDWATSLSNDNEDLRLKDLRLAIVSLLQEDSEYIGVIYIKQANGDNMPHLEVCGRKFSYTTKIKEVKSCLGKIMDNYGQRALSAEAQNGVDWKALSHAVRVANQAIELFKTGFVTFPLVNAKHILDIKLGKLPYQEVANEIENLLIEVEECAINSSLPDHPDYEFIDEIVLKIYSEEVK